MEEMRERRGRRQRRGVWGMFFHFKVKLGQAKALAVAHQVLVLHHLAELGPKGGRRGEIRGEREEGEGGIFVFRSFQSEAVS
jgi:hypothetical protein